MDLANKRVLITVAGGLFRAWERFLVNRPYAPTLECARSLRPGGLLAVSTPSQDFYAADPLCVSKIARSLIPKKVIPKLPALLRGPWIEQSLEEWEAKAGHYGHGCTLDELTTAAKNCGLQVIHHRYSYTPLSFFWFELLATFPLFGLLASPVATLSMAIESRMPVRSGANLMVRFRNVSPAGNA